jgi:hypothetical protein
MIIKLIFHQTILASSELIDKGTIYDLGRSWVGDSLFVSAGMKHNNCFDRLVFISSDEPTRSKVENETPSPHTSFSFQSFEKIYRNL